MIWKSSSAKKRSGYRPHELGQSANAQSPVGAFAATRFSAEAPPPGAPIVIEAGSAALSEWAPCFSATITQSSRRCRRAPPLIFSRAGK